MNLKFAWNRRSFLAALGAISGGLFAPRELDAGAIFGKKHKISKTALDGSPIVPIHRGLGSTGDIYAELGVTPLVNINGTVTVIGGVGVDSGGMVTIRPGDGTFGFDDLISNYAGSAISPKPL